jgi:enterochelin esterase family protein
MTVLCSTGLLSGLLAGLSVAQEQKNDAKADSPKPEETPRERRPGRGGQGPQVVSPEVQSDRRISFRLLAPKADAVRLNGGDIPGGGPRDLKKNDVGVWELTVGPIDPGAYRYTFDVDGVNVVDPRSPAVS